MAYDNSAAKTVYGSSDTMSFTVGSGSGRYLVVFIYLQTDTDKVTAVSYAGTAMTRLLRVNAGGGSSVFAYGLANPTSGANNVSVTLTDAGLFSYAAISADSITAATPVVAGTCSAFLASPSSQSATATGAGIAFGYHATGSDTANQFTVSGSTRGVQDLNSNLQATAYKTVSGAGSTSMTETWTGGNNKNGVKMVVLLEATGGGDTTAPTLTSPTGSSTGSTTATVGATTDEGNGTLYAVVTTSATAPTKAQIKAGQNAAGTTANWSGSVAVSSTGAKTLNATGLTASTTYYAHLMHEDTATNQSNVVSSTSFTTSAGASGSKGRFYYQFGSPQC